MTINKNIILIGFIGSGKSTVGKRLSKVLGWEFIDTDWEVEEITGLDIPGIFKRHGETRFRSEEVLVVKKIVSKTKVVIATGGGTVVNQESWEALAQTGVMIHLYAPVDVILDRVGHKKDRPLLKKDLEEVKNLWLRRQVIYQKADYTVDTSDKNIDQVVAAVLALVEEGKCLDALAEDRGSF
ncbi:MAG: shikimate kinase [Desulfitobacterium hafniense]|nr:shikimate kinase [Desulfitobacterium hafniense]